MAYSDQRYAEEALDADQQAVGAQIIRDLAFEAVTPKELDDNKPYALVVRDADGATRVEIIDPSQLDHLKPNPRRQTGTVKPGTLAALLDYVEFHEDEHATSLWVAPETGQVVALINDHAGAEGAPGWGDHRAIFTPRATAEWQRWAKADGQWLNQEQFAELLEDGLTEIADPAGATLLEVASTMTGHTSVQWEAATRLDNGAIRAKYVEDASAKAGTRGDLDIPTSFTLVLAVFHGEAPVQITARLRWRLRAGALTLSFKLDNPHRAVQESVDRIAEQASRRFTHVYIGQPR